MRKLVQVLILLSFVFVQGCGGMQTVSEATRDMASVEDEVEFDHIDGDGKEDGKGYIPYLKALSGPPKKVALVSFYAVDPATTKKSSSQIETQWLTEAGAKTVSNKMQEQSMREIKSAFAAHGMTVMLPNEYLTDDEKREFYKNFKPAKNTASNVVGGVMNFLRKASNQGQEPVMAAGDGYGSIFIENNGVFRMGTSTPDEKLTNSMGADLAKGLGVDAVLVVYGQFKVDDEVTALTEANMHLFGPNPVRTKKDEEGYFGSRPGHHYGGAYVQFKNGIKLSGARDQVASYDGFEKIFGSLSKKLSGYVHSKVGTPVRTVGSTESGDAEE